MVARLNNRQQAVERYGALESVLPKLQTDVGHSREQMLGARTRELDSHRKLLPQVLELGNEESRLKNLIQQYETWEKSPSVFKEHIRSLPPYVPWSVEQQKELVLESYAKFRHGPAH